MPPSIDFDHIKPHRGDRRWAFEELCFLLFAEDFRSVGEAMIILGRDTALTPDQRTDFEVIRRKYRNVVEIMTYDDLLRRLKTIRDQFDRRTEP